MTTTNSAQIADPEGDEARGPVRPMERPNVRAQFELRPRVGMNPMPGHENDPPVARIELTHKGCKGYSCTFVALPFVLDVQHLACEINTHMDKHHPGWDA